MDGLNDATQQWRLGKKYRHSDDTVTVSMPHLLPLILQSPYPNASKAHHRYMRVYAANIELGLRSGEPLELLLPDLPKELQDDYCELILNDYRVHNYGLLSGHFSHWLSLLGDLETWHTSNLLGCKDPKRRYGGLKGALRTFHSRYPQWVRPLWEGKKKPRNKLIESVAIARSCGLVNFTANEAAIRLSFVTKKLLQIIQCRVPQQHPPDITYQKLRNSWLFSEVVCPAEAWRHMVATYLEKTSGGVAFRNFLPFTPLLCAIANSHNWGHFRLSLGWMANMLGYYEDEDNALLSDYNQFIGGELFQGYTLEKLAEELDDEDITSFDISHLNPTRPKTSIRMSPKTTIARNCGYYLFAKPDSEDLRGKIVSESDLQKRQILDLTASHGIQRQFLVQPFHPEIWRRCKGAYRTHTVLRSSRCRWKAWFELIENNPETKPPLPNRKRIFDRRWPIELRRYRSRKYDPRRCLDQPVRDKKFKGQMHEDVLKCLSRFWSLPDHQSRKKEAIKIAEERFSKIKVSGIKTGTHGNYRVIQSPSPEQLRFEGHLNRLAQAAFAYLNRNLFDDAIDLYLPGCAPWMDSGFKFKKWLRRHKSLAILNFDIKSCYDNIDLANPKTVSAITTAINQIRSRGFSAEADVLGIIFIDYYVPLLQEDEGNGYARRGRLRHKIRGVATGLTLTPLLLYLVLFGVFLHLDECKQRGLIIGWTVAGDDFIVVGSPMMTANDRDSVWRPIDQFGLDNGFKFHHWKNYKDGGGLVSSYSARKLVDFAAPWIVEFPLYHLPLIHAGVVVFKGQINPNPKIAGEDVPLWKSELGGYVAKAQIKRLLFVSEQEKASNLFVPTALCHKVFINPSISASQLVNSFAATSFEAGGKELAKSGEATPGEQPGVMSTLETANPEFGNQRDYAAEYQALSQGPVTNFGGYYLAQRADSSSKWCLQFPPPEDRLLREQFLSRYFEGADKEELKLQFPLTPDIEAALVERFSIALKNDQIEEASRVLGEYQLRAHQVSCFLSISENPLGIPDQMLLVAWPFFGDKTELSYLFLSELNEFSECDIPLFSEARSVIGAIDWLYYKDSNLLDAFCRHRKKCLLIAPKLEWIKKGFVQVRHRVSELAGYLKEGCPLLPSPGIYFNRELGEYKVSKERLAPMNMITREPNGGSFWEIPKLLDDGPTWEYQVGFNLDYDVLKTLKDETLDLLLDAAYLQIRNLNQENFANVVAQLCPGQNFESYMALMLENIPKVFSLRQRIQKEKYLRQFSPEIRKRHEWQRWFETNKVEVQDEAFEGASI